MIRWLWILTGLVMLGRLCVAFALPLTGDEAYYWEWSLRPAFGYVDHPPAVAWTVAAFSWLGHGAGWIRFGFWLCGIVATFAAADAARRLAPKNGAAAAALTAACLSLAPMTSLAFATVSPDGPYLAAWACVIDAAVIVSQSANGLLPSALLGIAFGFALMSRAFAVAFIPAILVHLQTKRIQAAVALGIAGILSIPFLVWNSQHHWVTLVFTVSGRHVNEGFSLIRPLTSALTVLAALGIGPGIFAFGTAYRSTSWLLRISSYLLPLAFLIIASIERVEAYWFLGPFVSAAIAVGARYTTQKENGRQPSATRLRWIFGSGAALTALVMLVALFPFQILHALHIHLKKPNIFEIFTYRQLAVDLRRLSDEEHVAIMTDGYGFSSVLDYEAGLTPIFIGYSWQGREARQWVASMTRFDRMLFVDKEPLSDRPDFARRLAQACGHISPGPDMKYALPDLPPRIYPTTWCEHLVPNGLQLLRWETPVPASAQL